MNDMCGVDIFFNQSVQLESPNVIRSIYYGDLFEGDYFVAPKFMPAPDDYFTNMAANKILEEIELKGRRISDHQKLVYCLSDFLVASSATKTGLICWPSSSNNFPSGSAYTKTIAQTVRAALIKHGYLFKYQEQCQALGLARVYLVNRDMIDTELTFVRHGIGPAVSVREAKEVFLGRKVKGKDLPRSQFMPDIELLENQVKAINKVNEKHRLVSDWGDEFFYSKRIFNNGSLQVGGRLYGDWQSYNEEERLGMTIDGERVCEIDLKACYLQICNALIGPGTYLGQDPYQEISYIQKARNDDERASRRKLIKRLISAYLCKDGTEIGRFPKGEEKERNPETGRLRTVSIQEEFGLGAEIKHRDLMQCIFDAYPFLQNKDQMGCDLTFIESQIMIEAISNMVAGDLPAFPMHDCLIVRKRDKDVAIKFIQESMHKAIGMVFDMDYSYLCGDGSKVNQYAEINMDYVDRKSMELIDDLDVYEVIEDY
ncbi:MAG: hypothetical protein ABJN52_14645 [Litorimonas sp.]